jgi:hypothetical protein
LFREIESQFDVTDFSPIRIGLSTVGLSLVVNGTDAGGTVPISAAIVACQLFSEPEAGSDLAGVRTRAENDGDVAPHRAEGVDVERTFADVGLALVRTDADAEAPGLSAFIVPMHADGVRSDCCASSRVERASARCSSIGSPCTTTCAPAPSARMGGRQHWPPSERRPAPFARAHRGFALLLALADRQGQRSDPSNANASPTSQCGCAALPQRAHAEHAGRAPKGPERG